MYYRYDLITAMAIWSALNWTAAGLCLLLYRKQFVPEYLLGRLVITTDMADSNRIKITDVIGNSFIALHPQVNLIPAKQGLRRISQ